MEKVDMRGARVKNENVKLAQIKMFDVQYGGVTSFAPVTAYTIMVRTGEGWQNFLNPGWELPVFEKTLYTGCDQNGNDTHVFIQKVSGEVQDGPCYVMDFHPLTQAVGSGYFDRTRLLEEGVVTGEELENFALRTDLFMFDRINLIQDRNITTMDRTVSEDMKKRALFMQLMSESEKEKQFQ